MLSKYKHVVAVDFEFIATTSDRPVPVCMVARELHSGQRWRLWQDQLQSAPPFPTGRDTLFVSYYASAELGCFKVLNWPKPANILDLFTEFRNLTNGLPTIAGASLIGALAHFGLDSVGAQDKKEMRDLVLRGGPWSDAESAAILDYCESDVDALARLLPAMLPYLDLPRALLRGRYMAAAAAMEHNGVPIDVPTLELLRARWTDIQDDLIRAVDEFRIYDGRTFKLERWAAFLAAHDIPWPVLESGQLNLDDNAFREAARAYPLVAPYRELRSALADLRLNDLAVGHAGRNRTILSAFRSRTGRNQPSNSKYIFGPSVWLRGLIKPPPGYGIAYIDYQQQEFGIAAALSGDQAMQAAYRSGDPYLTFAKQAGAVPPEATKHTHGSVRELYKTCALAVQYGMEAPSLALRIGRPEIVAQDLLRAHRETYRRFWKWSDAAVDHAMLTGSLPTVFGWRVHVGENSNPRSLRNFPMQANGAEMLRLACSFATERGVEVCAPVHDAVLICAPLDRLEADIAVMRAAMAEASKVVLSGFEIGTDVKVVRYPHRYMDPRGAVMWDSVMGLIGRRQGLRATA
jgi:DNA polymerase I